MLGLYLGVLFEAAKEDEERAMRWRRGIWKQLAFVARYGHVTPAEAASYERADLEMLSEALAEIVNEENKVPHKR